MKRNKIEEVDVNAKERRQFKCDRCGMLCTYDKDYPYNLCYKCNQNLEDELFSLKLKRIKRLKNIIRKQIREIEQLKTEAYISLGNYKKSYKDLYFGTLNRNIGLYNKLKEKEKEIEKLKASCKSAINSFTRMETLYGIEIKKVDLLNEQLAEKEKECTILRKTFDLASADYIALVKNVFDDCFSLINIENLDKEKFYEFYRDLAEKMVDNGGKNDD